MKNFFKRLPLYGWARDARILLRWTLSGKPVPPPHLIKQRAIRECARKSRLAVLIETGTYRGDMIDALKGDFERIYSMELGTELHRRARRRFADEKHIVLLQGDSGEILGDLLQRIDRPCVFWLDSHYSDADTARGGLITPVRRELEHILSHPQAGRHVILIDDARLFTGEDDYPAMDDLRNLVRDAGFEGFAVRDDIIRIRKARWPDAGRLSAS